MFADNVPYNSKSFKTFAQDWNFEIVFSSPHYHQSNGLAERYVGIIKQMLKKAKSKNDLPMLLMEYRNTPLIDMTYSPSQLFLQRTVKTRIPISNQALKPIILNPSEIQSKLKDKQEKQKYYYDKNAKDMDKLEKGENILIQKGNIWERGKVEDIVNERSYIVKDSHGNILRRNRRFLDKTNLPYVNNSELYDINFRLSDDLYPNNVLNDNNELDTSEASVPQNMPKRQSRRPNYLNDYET